MEDSNQFIDPDLIKTFILEDLVGRRVDILGFENEEGKVIVAKDIKTKEGFLLVCEPKEMEG
ncbi:hypothetical protein [Maridesulfovibrio sp.]|uniref:hypothetical protein n=1 Tax=Maridesulfovibrio sp. TaxID=2795000 RepID=UPI0029CA2176|nr:hypothetical protein [Maridesulfovibrio sp.]